jgi:hypothetical protein
LIVFLFWDSGKRVSNIWIICLEVGNSSSKDEIILDSLTFFLKFVSKAPALREESVSYQLVGKVKAYQG